MIFKSSPKGFTLIEILIVVAIIGILATVVMGSLGSARIKSNNAHKNYVMSQYVNAFAIYYAHNDSYPSPSSSLPTNRKCLGFGNGLCGFQQYQNGNLSPGSQLGEQNAQLDAEVSSVYPAMTVFEKIPHMIIGNTEIFYAGPTYWCNSYSPSGRCLNVDLIWYLEGTNQTCFGGATATNQVMTTSCDLHLN